MAQLLTDYTLRVISIANTVSDLNSFIIQEASLPQYTRIVLEVHVDPSQDISSIAQAIEESCSQGNVPYWPENQGTYTEIRGNTLYIEYMRPYSGPSPMQLQILPILGIIAVIAPIIMYLASPTFRDLINGIIMLVAMMVMMQVMMPMMTAISGSSKPAITAPTTTPTTPKEPIEQRISKRIESIGESIYRIKKAFEKSKAAGEEEVRRTVSDIKGVARAIKSAPETIMNSYDKARAADRLDYYSKKLEEYKAGLTPSQLENLEEERRIVEELVSMYG